jgi:hypothetical protein
MSNRIEGRGAAALASGLALNTKLETLTLVLVLLLIVFTHAFSCVHRLTKNDICDEGAAALGDALARNATVQHL